MHSERVGTQTNFEQFSVFTHYTDQGEGGGDPQNRPKRATSRTQPQVTIS